MRTRTRLISAAALAGLVAVGGSAFTGSGLTSTAGPSQFVGGAVSQGVTGATLTDVSYGFTDATNTLVDTATLTFAADAAGKAVSIAFVNSGGATGTMTCTAVDSELFTSSCTSTVPAQDVTGATITVSA